MAVRRKGVRGGLTCSKCNSFACQRCLKSIVMHKHAKPLDRWMLEVKDFLRSNNHPEDFMGHCCEWSHLKQPVPTTASAPLRYDGCLHLFEFALLIDSPFTCVDIHGFGANPPWFKGAWHGAIGEICAARLLRDDVRALGTELRLQVEKPVVLHIPPVHGKGHPTKVLIQIVTAFQSMNFPESALKGSNNPPNEVIASSGFLPPPSKNVDITKLSVVVSLRPALLRHFCYSDFTRRTCQSNSRIILKCSASSRISEGCVHEVGLRQIALGVPQAHLKLTFTFSSSCLFQATFPGAGKASNF